LANHAREIAAIDFFTVPTVNFRILICFLVLRHHRRTVVSFNVTNHPTARCLSTDQLRTPGPAGSQTVGQRSKQRRGRDGSRRTPHRSRGFSSIGQPFATACPALHRDELLARHTSAKQ
jgi:hypothetical protein